MVAKIVLLPSILPTTNPAQNRSFTSLPLELKVLCSMSELGNAALTFKFFKSIKKASFLFFIINF